MNDELGISQECLGSGENGACVISGSLLHNTGSGVARGPVKSLSDAPVPSPALSPGCRVRNRIGPLIGGLTPDAACTFMHTRLSYSHRTWFVQLIQR